MRQIVSGDNQYLQYVQIFSDKEYRPQNSK